MKIGEVRKRFKMVWGSFMEAEGFVYKGGCYYRHEPENGIVKAEMCIRDRTWRI